MTRSCRNILCVFLPLFFKKYITCDFSIFSKLACLKAL